MRRVLCFLAALGVFLATSVAANPTAIVLNGNDNTVSTVDLGTDTPTLGAVSLPSYPSEALIRGGLLYIVVSGADRVLILDATTLTPVNTLLTGVGTNPYALDVDGSGTVYVSLLNTSELVRFDASGTETGRVPVGLSPEDVLLHNGELFVANTGLRFSDFGYDPGTISVLDPGTLATLDVIPVGMNPQWLVAQDNRVHTVCTGNYFSVFGEAHVMDATTHAPLDTVALGGSPGKLALVDDVLYTTDYFGGVFSYQASTGTVLRDAGNPLLVGGTGYTGVIGDGAGNLLITLYGDDALVRVRTSDETVTGVFATGDGPGCLVLRDDQVVPVELLTFSATAAGDAVTLRWQVVDAHEAATFVVERASEGGAWELRGEVFAGDHGEYHENAPVGTWRYQVSARLRTGELRVLGAREVTVGGAAFAVRPLANPARGLLRVGVRGGVGAVEVSLHDARGRRVTSWRGDTGEQPTFDLSSVTPGVYFLRATRGASTAVSRVVVVR